MNDYFKQEKYSLAQSQLRTQIISIKTSVASQIATLKNVLSSYEYELSEGKINWVQLDPFFGIAKADRVGGKNSNQFRITQFVGRSGSFGSNWNAAYLQKALARQRLVSDDPITVQLFSDARGTKFMTVRFANPNGRAVMVVGAAEYFQKYFDLSRGGKVTALLETSERVLAAHSEADYLGSLMDENAVSSKKFLIEREEIAGTNLVAMNFISRKSLAKGFAVPWSVVGLILGFGMLIVGVLIYTLDPIEKRIEKYKMQEREQVYKDTLADALAGQEKVVAPAVQEVVPPQTATGLVQAKIEKQKSELTPGPVAQALAPPPLQITFPRTPAPDLKPGFAETKKSIEDKQTQIANDFEKTFIPPQKKNPAVGGTGSIVLDSSQVETFEYAPSDSDGIDLDKVLALDEVDSEEAAQASSQFVQEKLTSKTINASQQIGDVAKPSFAVKKKEFRVDAIEVPVRRPERS